MKILTRYILREFLIPLAYCLTGFLSIYVLFDLFGSFSRMQTAGISFGMAVTYFCGYLAPYFHYIAPAALMLATLYTMWSFCRHSEIVAMRASGVSFLAIAKPLLAVAIVMAGLVVYVNEVYVPRWAHWAAQMKTEQFDTRKIERASDIVYRNVKDARTWNIATVLDNDATDLKGVRVTVDRPNGGARLMNIVADRARYLDGEWWFSGVQIQHYNELGQEIASKTPELDKIAERSFGEFMEKPNDFMMQNRPWKFNSVRDRLRYIRTHDKLTPAAKNDLIYDIWAQILAPLACLIITLFAIPAGIASGRQSVFKGILGALGMYFAFYGFTIGCMVLAKNGWCPPIAAALAPDIVFLVAGIRAFRRQR